MRRVKKITMEDLNSTSSLDITSIGEGKYMIISDILTVNLSDLEELSVQLNELIVANSSKRLTAITSTYEVEGI